MYLAAVVTDEGVEVQSMHASREAARLACHGAHWRVLTLDEDACAALAQHGIVVDEDGNGPDEIRACDVLPDVWSDRETLP